MDRKYKIRKGVKMKRIEIWLNKEVVGWKIPIEVFLTALASLFYAATLIYIASYLNYGRAEGVSANVPSAHLITNWEYAFWIMPQVVFHEEVRYRVIPLLIALCFTRNIFGILFVSAIFSAGFGYSHGNFMNILVQGVFGMVCCIVFLKFGGMARKFFKGFVCAVSTHLCYNWIGLVVVLCGF